MKIRTLILSVLITALCFAPAWAQVSAQLDRTTVYEGDTVTLTLESDDASGVSPDLSPLEEDFEVLSTGTGRQIQIINGRRSDTRQWHITLRPKKMGTLRVPAISLGAEQTSALSMTVIDSMPVAEVAGQQMFLETKVENDDVYLQQQIRFVARLYYRLPLLDGQLSDPSVANAVVQKLGDDRKIIIEREGLKYNVIERHYAIFPEKSGELRIPPLRFQGRVETPQSRQAQRRSARGSFMEDFFGRDPFDDPFFGSGRRAGEAVGLKSEAITIMVKPQPSDYSADAWIPAASVSLEDSWVEAMPEFIQGEPVTRTVVLIAKGLTAPQLPDFTLKVPDGFKVYPEKPATETHTDGRWAYAITRVKLSYVPVKSGFLDIPEQNVSWWNTEKSEQVVTRLTAWQVNVAASEMVADEVAENPPALSKGVEDSTKNFELAVANENLESESTGKYFAAAILLFLLGGLGWWLIRARREVTKAVVVKPIRPKEDLKAGLLQLQKATASNDKQASADALLNVAKLTWKNHPPAGLGALMELTEQGYVEIRKLDKALYGSVDEKWAGEELWDVFAQGFEQKKVVKDKNSEVLPPLYPH